MNRIAVSRNPGILASRWSWRHAFDDPTVCYNAGRMSRSRGVLSPVCVLTFALLIPAYPNYASQDVPLHVLRIVAGPSGNQVNGTFLLSEERSVFNRADDRDVIVVFQWEGRPGQHKLIAQWRSPDGTATSNSTVNYLAKDRKFGAYWRLSLSPTMPTGTWAIEATVDDEPAGRLTFEITDSKVDASKARRPLTQAMLFEHLGRIFVSIERFSAAGRRLDSFSGLIGPRGRIYTTIGAIDDVDRLRAVHSHWRPLFLVRGEPDRWTSADGADDHRPAFRERSRRRGVAGDGRQGVRNSRRTYRADVALDGSPSGEDSSRSLRRRHDSRLAIRGLSDSIGIGD